MAALMSSVMNTKDRVPQYVAEARAMKIQVLPPDVNESGRRFTVVGETIRFGLSAVKNVGDSCVDSIIAAREDGSFEDIFDFCERVDPKTYNKRTLESLIKCGAFDNVGPSRAAMVAVHAKAVERSTRGLQRGQRGPVLHVRRVRARAARSPSSRTSRTTSARAWSGRRRPLASTSRTIPLRPVLHKLKKHTDTTVSELEGYRDGAIVWVGGLATSVRTNTTRKGDMMAMLQLDDTRGLAEVMVFPRVYARCAECVREDAVLKVKGKVEMKEGIPRIVALEMEELHLEPGADPVYLDAGAFVGHPRNVAREAFGLLRRHPGESPLFLVSGDGDAGREDRGRRGFLRPARRAETTPRTQMPHLHVSRRAADGAGLLSGLREGEKLLTTRQTEGGRANPAA